jgi:tetratricopeptide (TPR) repeat protein
MILLNLLLRPAVLLAPVLVLALGFASPALAQGAGAAGFEDLAKGWAHVNYEIKDPKAEAAAARALVDAAEAAARKDPGRAEPLAWEALALLCEADARHNFSSLQLVGKARSLLERAAKMDANAIGPGSIYANLGSLYADLPGFPVSFGDAGKARTYLDKALAADPTGLDANYFYGDFLYRQGHASEAIQALEKALQAPGRPGRSLADRGRKWEATQLLDKIRRKEKLSDASDLRRKPA